MSVPVSDDLTGIVTDSKQSDERQSRYERLAWQIHRDRNHPSGDDRSWRGPTREEYAEALKRIRRGERP